MSIRPARSFSQLIPLLREAGLRLRARGLALPQRVRALRGLYYGSPHSLDYERRRSRLRNLGFNFYLKALPPPDPAPLLGAPLARALKDSAVVSEGGRCLDVGHVVIGLDARRNAFIRRWPIPTQGGSGLELATWLGDLGGAAGLLALARARLPQVRAKAFLFDPEGYDLRPNLEGDVAAYLVARSQGEAVRPQGLRPFLTVADALQDYWQGDWDARFARFAPMIGAPLERGRLADPVALQARLQAKVGAFAFSYTLARLWHDAALSRETMQSAARHVRGAAQEVSALFVAWLASGLAGDASVSLPDLEPNLPGQAPRLLRWARALGGV